MGASSITRYYRLFYPSFLQLSEEKGGSTYLGGEGIKGVGHDCGGYSSRHATDERHGERQPHILAGQREERVYRLFGKRRGGRGDTEGSGGIGVCQRWEGGPTSLQRFDRVPCVCMICEACV
jgi:hypothetical protein